MRGTIIKAYIVRENTNISEQEIKYQAHKRLASYKTPRMIVFVEEIPRNAQGQVLQSQLPRSKL